VTEATDGRHPAFVVLGVSFAVIEILSYLFGRKRYPWREAGTTVIVAIGYFASAVLTQKWIAMLAPHVAAYAPFSLTRGTWYYWLLLFLIVDLVYYLMHRLCHHVRIMWSSHVVHHTPSRLILPAGYRLGWTNLLTGFWLIVLVPTALGFHTVDAVFMFAANFGYQYLLHNELVPKLGPLEWVLNTPSHHRVHHATDAEYLDRNFGGVLILWDRWFGTFAEETHAPREYGVIGRSPSLNPLTVVFLDTWRLLRDAWATGSVRRGLAVLVESPQASDRRLAAAAQGTNQARPG